MCYTVTTEYIQCSHTTSEYHECARTIKRRHRTGKWKGDKKEDEFLKIQRTKTSLCPKCSGDEAPEFTFPEPAPVSEMPTSLQHGHHIFEEICEQAYNAWETVEHPIRSNATYRTLDRNLVESAINKTTEKHMVLKKHDTGIVHPLPQSIQNSLYPAICRELTVMSARVSYDMKESTKRFHIRKAAWMDYLVKVKGTGPLEGHVTEEQRAIIRREQIYSQRDQLEKDLRLKHPNLKDAKIIKVLDDAETEVKGLSEDYTNDEIKTRMREYAFEHTSNSPFPPTLTTYRNYRFDTIIKEVLNSFPNPRISSVKIQEMAGECEALLWDPTQEEFVTENSEGTFIRRELKKRVAEWEIANERRLAMEMFGLI